MKTQSNTKSCSMCKEEKAIEEFYIVTVKASGEQFHHSRCKGCNAKACLAWRKRNRDGYNKSARLWRIKKKYNIDKDTYARMLSNGCEVCGGFDALAVDHDHGCCPGEETCGKCVRGMLCKRHNWAMGNLNDSSDEARALAEYIDRTRG